MKFKRYLLLGVSLALLLSCGILVSCRNGGEGEDTAAETAPPAQTSPGAATESPAETEAPAQTEEETTFVEPTLVGPYADSIMLSNRLADGVQVYFPDPSRQTYRVENQNMTLDYALTGDSGIQVASLRNKAGGVYLENTMDAFVRMEDGKTYYASSSASGARTNIYRLGYYYYEAHVMGQDFMDASTASDGRPIRIHKATVRFHDAAAFTVNDGVISYVVSGGDPYAYTTQNKKVEDLCFPAAEYNALRFSVKVTASSSGELYFIAGPRTGHSADQCVRFSLTADGAWHTYTVLLDGSADYTDMVTSLRFDIGSEGERVEIKDVEAVKLDDSAPALQLDRVYHTYSDKVNHVLNFVARETVTGIEALGSVTRLPADRVAALVVKDKAGTHDTLNGVDWASAEYVGFDIKDAGILGFILLPHENSGRLGVTLSDGVYTVTQTSTPAGGTLQPPNRSTDNNYYMGQRVYTDESHDFAAFLAEAEHERNPLETVGGESYLGYDALRGAYQFSIGGTGFNEPFFTAQNRHYTADVSVRGGDTDRNIYVYTHYSGGTCENALIADEGGLILPIPTMICKNFGGEDEEPFFNAGDRTYSEAYFPLSVKAGSETELTVLNLYMNWGKMPLKQLSSIQFFWPYYHLSLGTTETSCISPWYGARDLWTLPDFRSMSMPYWFELEGDAYDNQPQHTHGGYQYFLQYTDADGKYSASEVIRNDIDSSGPVYTDVRMDYLSDDGRMMVSYVHTELPETDELRAYYEITYTVLEDITISDFRKDFSFYSLEGYAGYYRRMGYLDENNKITHKEVNGSSKPEVLRLGDDHPYLALYDLHSDSPSWATNNVNLGFVIADSSFTIGGEACDAGFVAVGADHVYSLSLDLGEVTLKAGDTMKLGLIISPWGFYNSQSDSNMQEIRKNTCLDPLTLTVLEGEAMEWAYVPKLRTVNGTSAEFTLSGASNNKAVRIYGFDKLTAPVIYEKVKGEWVPYVVSSSLTPDGNGTVHHYDGYAVYYDRNGTYSYAFAVDMDVAESRTFRIVAEEDFTGWPEEAPPEVSPLPLYKDAADLAGAAANMNGIGEVITAEDGSFVRIHSNGSAPEGYFTVFSDPGLVPTGKYLVVKYRLSPDLGSDHCFEFFTSTVNSGPTAEDYVSVRGLIADGEWQVMIMDLAAQNLPTFEAAAGERYIAKYLRMDIYNAPMATESYVDLAYLGMTDSVDDICKLNADMTEGRFYRGGRVVGVLDFATGRLDGETGGDYVPGDMSYIHPDSGRTLSEVPYISAVDFINGTGDGNGAYDNRGGRTGKGIDVFAFNGPTTDDGYLAVAGWTMIFEGTSAYLWSADGGLTWQDCELYNRTAFGSVKEGDGIPNAADAFFGVEGYASHLHGENATYQGSEGTPSGVAMNLSAFAGQTVDVLFAAVPATDPDGLCLIALFEGVRVAE